MITGYPLRIDIELTNHCNIRCSFCPREHLKKKKGFMNMELYMKIINNIREDGRKVHIFLHGFGEPLLHPRLIDMINYAKEKKVAKTIQFSTNGLLLKKGGVAEGLVKAGLDEITVSVDAVSEISYRQLKGVELGVIEGNVRGLMELKKKMGVTKPHVRAKIMFRDNNRREKASFLRKWRALADSATVDWYSNWGGMLGSEIGKDSLSRYSCAPLWYALVVRWDGTSVACCVDINGYYPTGDLNKDSISEVWNGDRMKVIRQMHISNSYERLLLCKECMDWQFMPNIDSCLKKYK